MTPRREDALISAENVQNLAISLSFIIDWPDDCFFIATVYELGDFLNFVFGDKVKKERAK